MFALTAPYIVKYTAIIFPLVKFTKERVDCSSIALSLKPVVTFVKILKSLQGFQIKFKISNNLQITACYTGDKIVAFYLIII